MYHCALPTDDERHGSTIFSSAEQSACKRTAASVSHSAGTRQPSYPPSIQMCVLINERKQKTPRHSTELYKIYSPYSVLFMLRDLCAPCACPARPCQRRAPYICAFGFACWAVAVRPARRPRRPSWGGRDNVSVNVYKRVKASVVQ